TPPRGAWRRPSGRRRPRDRSDRPHRSAPPRVRRQSPPSPAGAALFHHAPSDPPLGVSVRPWPNPSRPAHRAGGPNRLSLIPGCGSLGRPGSLCAPGAARELGVNHPRGWIPSPDAGGRAASTLSSSLSHRGRSAVTRFRRRSAFTLIELLVVIAI